MFSMFYSFDANQAFNPLSLVTSLLMILQEGLWWKLQAAVVTANGRVVAHHLRHCERHRLLGHGAHWGGGIFPGNILEIDNPIREDLSLVNL